LSSAIRAATDKEEITVLDLIRKIWKTKTVTKTNLFEEAPSRFRGKPVLVSNECTGCGSCAASCPSDAINFNQNEDSYTLSISYAHCIFCGICAEECETKMIQVTNEYRLAAKNKNDLQVNITVPSPALFPAGKGV
jgi:formate hydrogenlyase subunit 6/NADH:ubiquinone oxidoreductase subunit I